MRFFNLCYYCTLLYICCMTTCSVNFSVKMFDLSDTDPIDFKFNNVLVDSCTYVDMTESASCSDNSDNSNSLNLLQLNSRGVLSKQERIKLLLKELRKDCNIHVVFLMETWLTNKNSKRFKIPGFNFVGSHRKCKQGGGVGILIAQNLEFRET